MKIEELDPISEIIVDEGVDVAKEKFVDFFKDHENWFSDIKVYELPQKYTEPVFLWFGSKEVDRGFGELFIYNTKTQDVVAILYKIYPNNEMISIVSHAKAIDDGFNGVDHPYIPIHDNYDGWITQDIIYVEDITKIENIAGVEG